MHYSYFKFLMLFCVFFLCGIKTSWALEVQDVRFGVHPDKTRMVIELSDKKDFRAFMLPQDGDKAYRLVLDLPSFNWQAGEINKPRQTNVLDVRSGTLSQDIKRIVIDLGKPAALKTAFFLPKGNKANHRLVIDFNYVSPALFEKSKRIVLGTLSQDTQPQNNSPQSALDQKAGNASNSIVTPQKKPKDALPPSNTQSAFQQPPLRKPLIVIDAGHGGADPGAIGANKSFEKNVTLTAAKILKKKLQSTGRYNVHLTRDKDIYLKLYQRRNIARKKEADLFISLHADSIDKPNVRGASIYTLSNKASDAQTARLAARENQADAILGIDLSHEDKEVADILIDLAMRDTMNQSKFFANTVVDHMQKSKIRTLKRPHRYAGFAVLKSPDVPSVLFEMGFMSNRGEAKLLSSRAHQNRIAQALVDSIDSYFKKIRQNTLQ